MGTRNNPTQELQEVRGGRNNRKEGEAKADVTKAGERARTEYNQRSKTHRRRQEEDAHIPDTLEKQIEEWMGKEGITFGVKENERKMKTRKLDTAYEVEHRHSRH